MMTNQLPNDEPGNPDNSTDPLKNLPEFVDGHVLKAKQLEQLVNAIRELERRIGPEERRVEPV